MIRVLLIVIGFSLNFSVANAAKISPQGIQQVQAAQVYIQKKQYQPAQAALKTLIASQFPLEQAYGWRLQAQMSMQQAAYAQAVQALKQALALQVLTQAEALSMWHTLAGLHWRLQQTQAGIQAMQTWMQGVPKIQITAQDYLALAQAYSQEKLWSQVAVNVQKAIQKQTPEAVPEAWFQLQLAASVHQKDWRAALKVSRHLLKTYPHKVMYWQQVAQVYQQRGHLDKTLAIYRAAWLRGYLTREQDYQRLANFMVQQNVPQRAVEVLHLGFKRGHLGKSTANLNLLAWAQARAGQGALAQQMAYQTEKKPHLGS
ncbi:hypothetical protein SAMN05421831_11214 [Allopseudospirillum japonicum]|uniref:Tetratricopeptide repeat-containing protein n=1 Tax=Allopseudospirillum japonicum TaxID=64971 RepID=A0A1H6U4S2_9GAMM|nr:hypothetical protein [Allopseudospirillum japonicum]SEI83375.1 hypothetical protein SAMN05421831_11214 [Allopseudospirillum japonicum]